MKSQQNQTSSNNTYPNNINQPKNPFLTDVYRELLPLYILERKKKYNFNSDSDADADFDDVQYKMDGFLLYLFGVVVRELRRSGGGPITSHASSSNNYKNNNEITIINDTDHFASNDENINMNSKNYNNINDHDKVIPNAIVLLTEAAHRFPFNWSCWLELR